MLLGSLVDVGVSPDALQGVIAALGLPGCELCFERVQKGSLAATQATITAPQRQENRHLGDLIAIVRRADLPEAIKNRMVAVLQRMGEVEAKIHDQPIEQVHLHELSGDDTLIDIAGVLIGLAELEVDRVGVSPLPLGRGFTQSAHGTLPLPAPATLALLMGVPIRYMDVDAELVTPTGAALLTELADDFGGFPPMTLQRVGYGAGQRDLPFPNLVRLWLGETAASEGLIVESLFLIETNIDDLNPQVYTHVMERLFASGALDVTLTSQQMKKNRPGVLLGVLCPPELSDDLMQIVFEETTTLGIRRQMVERISLPRACETIETVYGPIRVKVAKLSSGTRRTPEFEDCREAAEAHSVPVIEVIEAARRGR
jgi:uncharacterized protein (TIGR00299 family) protein